MACILNYSPRLLLNSKSLSVCLISISPMGVVRGGQATLDFEIFSKKRFS